MSFVPADGKSSGCAGCGKTVYSQEAVRAINATWHKGCLKCTACNITLNLKTAESFENKPYCKPHLPTHKATQVADKATESALNAPRAAAKVQGIRKDARMTFAPGSAGPVRARGGGPGGAPRGAPRGAPAGGPGGAARPPPAAASGAAATPVAAAPSAAAPRAAPAPAAAATSAPRGISSSRGGAPKFGATSKKCPVCGKTVYDQEEVKACGNSYHKGCLKCTECQISLNLKTAESFENKPYCKVHLPKQSHTQVASIEMQTALKAPKAARAQQGVDRTARTTFAPGRMNPVKSADVGHSDSASDVQSRHAPQQRFVAPETTPHLTYEDRNSGLTGAADKFAKSGGSQADSGYGNQYAAVSAPEQSYGDSGYDDGSHGGAYEDQGGYDDGSHGGYDEGGYDEGGYDDGSHAGGYDDGSHAGGYDDGSHGGYEEPAAHHDDGAHAAYHAEEGGYDEGGYAEEGGYDEGGYAEEGGYDEGYYEEEGYDEGYEEEGYY